jgi:hypothetical protein
MHLKVNLKVYLLLCFMLIIPEIKIQATNPEWIFHKFDHYAISFIDDGDFMWIGMRDWGIYKYYKETQTIVDSIIVPLHAFVKDENGNFWISTINGLIKNDGVNSTNFNKDNSGLPDNAIRSIVIDKYDIKWIGTNKGLAKFDDKNWVVYNTQNSGLPSNLVSSLVLDKNDNLWIGTTDNGLAKFDGIKWTVYNYQNSGIPMSSMDKLIFDKIGNLWIGSYVGLTKYDGKDWVTYDYTNSKLPDKYVSEIAIDSANNKWIGYSSREHSYGLVKFDDTNWSIYITTNSGIKGNCIYAITIDKAGNKWLGVGTFDYTIHGVNIFKEGGVVLSDVEVNSKLITDKTYIYPNPAGDYITIQPTEGLKPSEGSRVEIFDMLGVNVSTSGCFAATSASGGQRIDVSFLSPGIYFIKIGNRVEKFVKI